MRVLDHDDIEGIFFVRSTKCARKRRRTCRSHARRTPQRWQKLEPTLG
jgi:hypothetical protein